MGAKTAIQWTESTWTPIRARDPKTGKVGWHCTKPSAGCKFCYSEEMNVRLGSGLRFTALASPELFINDRIMQWPSMWRAPRRIFVCSMTDLFGEFHSWEMILDVFGVMAKNQRHTYLILTKRPDRALQFVEHVAKVRTKPGWFAKHDWPEDTVWPLPCVWQGVTAENQATADERLPILRRIPAAMRFVSVEPMLEKIDLRLPHPEDGGCCSLCGCEWEPDHECSPGFGGPISWLIFGGESGKHARRCKLEWIVDGIQQCREAGAAAFVKQLGGNLDDEDLHLCARTSGRSMRHPKGGEPSEWWPPIRVQQYPEGER